MYCHELVWKGFYGAPRAQKARLFIFRFDPVSTVFAPLAMVCQQICYLLESFCLLSHIFPKQHKRIILTHGASSTSVFSSMIPPNYHSFEIMGVFTKSHI